jgi:hypothetical protein
VDDLAEACGKCERDEKYILGSGLETEKKRDHLEYQEYTL